MVATQAPANSPQKVFSAATSGTAEYLFTRPPGVRYFTVQVTSSAALGAGQINLAGSLDGVNYDTSGDPLIDQSLTGLNGTKLFYSTTRNVYAVKVTLSGVTGGTADVWLAAGRADEAAR